MKKLGFFFEESSQDIPTTPSIAKPNRNGSICGQESGFQYRNDTRANRDLPGEAAG